MSSPEWKCRRGLLKLVAFLFYLSIAVLFAQVEANVVTSTVRARARRLVTGSSRVECVNAHNRPLSHRIFCLNGCKSSSSTSSTPSQSASASIESPPQPPTVIRAKSVREFVQKCKPNNGNSNQQANHLSQILTKTIRNETLFERRRENGQTMTVFVLDFRLVTGSVYIDFKSSPAMLKPDQQLILNVVTKQFVTFRLLNVPSRARLRVLVNGEARVSYVEKKDVNEANSASTVEIWHAPLYDRFANRSEWVAYLERSTGVNIRRYVEYLNLFCHLSHLRIDLDLITQLASGERFTDQQLVEYMEMEDPSESLLQICSLNESPSTQEQSQNGMADSRSNSLSSQDNGAGGGNRPFWSGRGGGNGNPLSFLQSINAAGAYASFSNQNDLSFLSSGGGGGGGGGGNFRPNILDIDTYEFYMFEIEHDEANDFEASPNHFLRLFIDECDFNKKYILILYINLKNSSDSTPIRKKIILDDFDCPIRAVYSNAEVFDQLNLLYHEWNYLNVTKIVQDYKNANSEHMKTTTNAFSSSDDDIRNKLAYILPYDLNFSLNNTFYYLKITKTANDIELIFLSAEGRLTLAHNKFFNKLNQQTFVSSSSSMSNSMKFVLKEHDILEYFKENHLKLDSFLHSDKKAPSNLTRLILAQNGLMRQRDSRFFFISSHRCPVIFLSSIIMVDQIDHYLLLFDSKLYDNQSNTDGITTSNECFYYEKSTESFYATFGFAINELTFRNSFYFTIKQQLEKPKENNNKNPLYSLSSLNNIKEKAVDEYFMNVIHSTIKLNYTVQSSARLLTMSQESSALEADLWQQHNSNRHRKNRLKDDFSAKQKPSSPPTVKLPQPKPAHVELDVHIRLTALDDSIAWRLDSCWFNDNFCINKLETTMNSFDGGGSSVKQDANYAGGGAGNANNSGEHYQDEFAEEEDMDLEEDYDEEEIDTAMVNSQQRLRDYDHVEENGWSNDDDNESYYEHLIDDNPTPKPTPPPPSSTRRNRKSRNQPNMISYELKSSSISFERSPADQLFVFSARFTLVFNPLLNGYSKPYILCNMKPYAAPCDSDSSSSSSLNGSSHDSNHCDEKSSSSKAAKFMEREKAAGNKVKTIVLTQMRRAEPSNASTSEPEIKFAFDSTQHLAPNKKHRLPDCTWFVRYYNDNTNNANGSQQTKDAKNNKTANLSASMSWLLDWAHANLFTIVLVVLFVVSLVGFIVLVKLVFFRDCNLCSKLVLFKKPSNGQNGSSSSATNQNGNLMAIDAEQQLSLLDHKVPDHQPPGNGNLTQSKHIININSTHENNHLISNRQQKSEATTNHL